MQEKTAKDWAESLTLRIRNACMGISQALRKVPQPAWVVELLQLECEVSTKTYGYDFESRRAWRADSAGRNKEYAAVYVPKGAEPADFPEADFGDKTWVVKGLTVAEFPEGADLRAPKKNRWGALGVCVADNTTAPQDFEIEGRRGSRLAVV